MRAIGIASSVGTLLAGVLLSTSTAWAVMPNPMCVDDAAAQKKLCKMTCQEQFHVDVDECRNVDHDCADACRAGRQGCFDGPLSALQTCIAGCKSTLDQVKADCRTQFPDPEDPQRDACIDAAQVVAFQCRDACREALDRDALKACRIGFRACIRACPPAH